MSYSEHLAANRRLCILKLLIEECGISNESVLELALRALGHHAGVDRPYVRAQLDFLEQAGCVRIEYFKDKVMVAHLKERGTAVARGAITIDGIAKPSIGE